MKKTIIIIICIVIAIGLYVAATHKGIIGSVGRIGQMSSTNSNAQTLPDGTEQTFSAPSGDFSFTYIAPYSLSRIEDESGETVLLQKEGSGLQVYITDFVDTGVFNATRVKKEVGGNLEHLQDIQMPGGFPAVTFSTKVTGGDQWDVWFVAGEASSKTLYQITVDPGNDAALKKLVETWKFE